jgi:hypothetical protein
MANVPTYVLLPVGSRAEFDEARRAFKAHEGRTLIPGAAHAHTPGQRLYGDVVVVGAPPATIEQDAQGRVWRVDRIEDLAGLDFDERPRPNQLEAAVQAPAAEPELPEPEEHAPGPELEVEPEQDDLDEMDRVKLIQHAAAQWPGQGRWATMSNLDLMAYIRRRRAEKK